MDVHPPKNGTAVDPGPAVPIHGILPRRRTSPVFTSQTMKDLAQRRLAVFVLGRSPRRLALW